MTALFSGLKILDLSTVLAGPSVATFFAELGAQVIKVENPRVPDVTRSWKLPSEDPTAKVSAYFSSINYNKSYLQLNLLSEADRQEIERLIKASDVMITNFKHGDADKFNLNWKDVSNLNPRLILAQLSGYSSQPERVAYDVVLQAETGFMFMNGTPDSGPVKMPVAMVDVLAAHQLKEGILSALLLREKTGKGALVDCSLEKAALASLVNQSSNYLMTGHVPQRLGSLHPNIAPYGETFTCSDGKTLVLAIGSDKQFEQLCILLGLPELTVDPRFFSNTQRVMNRKELAEILGLVFSSARGEDWIEKMHSLHLPAGLVKNMAEVLAGAAAQAMVLTETIDGVTTKRLSSVAFNLSQSG